MEYTGKCIIPTSTLTRGKKYKIEPASKVIERGKYHTTRTSTYKVKNDNGRIIHVSRDKFSII